MDDKLPGGRPLFLAHLRLCRFVKIDSKAIDSHWGLMGEAGAAPRSPTQVSSPSWCTVSHKPACRERQAKLFSPHSPQGPAISSPS